MSKLYLSCLTVVSSLLLSFSLSAQIDFTEHTIALGGQNFPGGGETADFDGDGLLDILVYNSGGHRTNAAARQTLHIAWYKNLGTGEYQKHPISITHVNKAIPYDYDNDGDIDILCSYYYRGTGDPRDNNAGVRILLNDGSGKFSTKRIHSVTSSEIFKQLELKDINNDGYMDFLFGYENEDWDLERVGYDEYIAVTTGKIRFSVSAFINSGNGDFKSDYIGGFSVYDDGGYIAPRCGDLNNDGYLDFAVMVYNDDTNDAILSTRIFNPVDSTFIYYGITNEILNDGPPSLFDYDDDGDLDILQYYISDGNGGGNAIQVLFENDGSGNFTQVQIPEFIPVPAVFDYPELDFDNDGDLDQIRRQYSWHENTGTDYIEHVIDSALIGNNTKIADLDQDGDWDIIVVIRDDDSEDYKRVFLWINDGAGNYSKQLLEDKNYWMRNFVAADLDGDGDNDLAATSWINGDLFWYKNDGAQNFTENLIAKDQKSILDIKLMDLDGDGDMDFVTTYSLGNHLAWWQNDGVGNFTKDSISTNSENLYEVTPGDFDGDGDIDFVTVEIEHGTILLWKNDGNNNFSKHLIYDNNFANPIESVDIDQDGDLDIIIGFVESDEVRLLRNDGTANFTATSILDDINPGYLEIIDLDQDGNIDILVSDNSYNGKLIWVKNTGSDFITITLGETNYYSQTASGDYDGDGDIDIFCQKAFSQATDATNDLKYLENDGNQNFTESTFDPRFLYGRDLQAFDLDQDGDLDLLGTSVALGFKWYENLFISDQAVLSVADCPQNITIVTTDNFGIAEWDLPTATTTCDDQNISITQIQGLPSGSDFAIGTHEIEYEITDECDNKNTCSFTIVIEEEPIIAVLTLLTCPQNITETTSDSFAAVTWNLPTAETTCNDPNISLTLSEGMPSGSDFSLGTHVIEYEIADACGNSETCAFTVSVEEKSDAECPTDVPSFTFLGEKDGHKYFLSTFVQNWKTARETARNEGGYLASINDQAENDFLFSKINAIVFIGFNDLTDEGNFAWDSGESVGFENLGTSNSADNNFGNINFWNGEWSLDNKWVSRKFILEIDCDSYKPCSLTAEVNFLQCDDNETADEPNDDNFSFELAVTGYGDLTTWNTEINGQNYSGGYDSPLELDALPLFAPGQTVTISIEENSGNCSTTATFEVPEPCPNEVNCPTTMPGYEFLGEFGGNHYFISNEKSTWVEASQYVKGKGGYLVVLETEEENNWLQNQVSEIAFIGLSDNFEEGNVGWSNGAGFAYSNFGTCGICPQNTEENDFGIFNFWDGTWSFDNQWIYRRHIVEVDCALLAKFDLGRKINPNPQGKITAPAAVTLFPNPVSQTVNLDFVSEKEGEEVFRIFNLQNQLIFEKTIPVSEGKNRVQFDVSNQPSGFYFLKMTSDERALKFIIENKR